MIKKNTNLYNLLDNDLQARNFFTSQPDYVMGKLHQHVDKITSYNVLVDYTGKIKNNMK